MNALRLFLILMMMIVGVFHHLFKHSAEPPVAHATQTHSTQRQTTPVHTKQAAVDKELLQNAERLSETLRRCKETAHMNRETK
jgi:hypothetical protein